MNAVPRVHPALNLDASVDRVNESVNHWAEKATVVGHLKRDPTFFGTVDTDRKTSDRIGDVWCVDVDSAAGYPERFVVEIERESSDKNRLGATIDHLRHGFAVYWVFDETALDKRRGAEELLGEHLSTTPSFGAISLEEGELTLGSPVVWDEFNFPTPVWGGSELYVPTHHRYRQCYDLGDFLVYGERMGLFRVRGEATLFASKYSEDDQQTLLRPTPWEPVDLYGPISEGDVVRVSPVRGPP